jgi:hypothetical protein
MPLEQINNNGYQMFLDTDSVFAPREQGLERQAKQNALARQQSVRNALAQSYNPKTGLTNYEFANQIGGVDIAPELQASQQADALRQEEFRSKQATTDKARADAAKTNNELMISHLQTMGGLIGAAKDETSYQANVRQAAAMGYDVSELPPHFDANYVVNLHQRALTAEQQLKQQNEEATLAATQARDQATAAYQTGQLGVARGNLEVNQATERRAQAAYESSINPDLQRQLAEAKKRGEENAGKGPAATSAAAAQAFLTSAGYDPKTGSDTVSKLIPKSTGGLLQTAVAKTAGAFNITTSGQEAIGQLASRSSKLVLDLLGGKLGAGVSNADREFMLQAVGDIGNSLLPTGVRLAAWNDLMNRMKTAAGGGAAPAAPTAAGPRKTKSGVAYTVEGE